MKSKTPGAAGAARSTISVVEHDHYAVIKIKGINPEVFWIAFISMGLPRGSFMKTSGNLSENELHSELATMGRTESEINYLIQREREYPV